VTRAPLTVLGLVAGLVAIKALVLYVVARFAGQSRGAAVNLALYISQGGEFAFVLFGVATSAQAMDKALSDLLVVVVSASMAVTPLLVTLNDKVLKIGCRAGTPREFDTIDSRDHRVIIAGFGRVGQVVARILRTQKIPFTALEANFEQVDFVRKFGSKIYFGDASRLDLLHAAGADKAEIFVLAIDDVEASLRTAQMVKAHYPHIKIYARARNRMHAYQLMDLGVQHIMRETFLSSLEMARDVLLGLGQQAAEADATTRRFRQHDEALLHQQQAFHHDEARLIASTRQARDELERLFEQDRAAVKPDGE
jgi:voltage-gated potassium channel Kch